jgi:hypothetical protein
MNRNRRQATRTFGCPGFRARPILLPLVTLGLLLSLGATVPVLASSNDVGEAGRLYVALIRAGKLAGRGLRPPAQRLARELPEETRGLSALREPASTAQDQLGIALGELREMNAPATLNPHYLPALVAAGRAFVAVSGQDPLTRTTINPDYVGLEAELAASEERLSRSAENAGKLSARLDRLTQALSRAKRRARRVEREVRRLQRGDSGPPGG